MTTKLWALVATAVLLAGGTLALVGQNETQPLGGVPPAVGGPTGGIQGGNNTTANATVRITPQTLNLRSQGKYVTVHLEVAGVDPTLFNVSALVIVANGTNLTVPAGSPSSVQVNGTVVDAMVKLDRQALIQAFGTSGTYEVVVKGPAGGGEFWSATTTVRAILP